MTRALDALGALAWVPPWIAYTTTSAIAVAATVTGDLIRGALR